MEYERNNILGNFRYGFCNLLGETSNINECESKLGWNETAMGLLREVYPIVGKMNLDLSEERKSTIIINEYDLLHDEIFNDSRNSRWQTQYGTYFQNSKDDKRSREIRPMEVLSELSDYNDIIIGLRELLYSEIELCNYKILDEAYEEVDKIVSSNLFKLGLHLTNFSDESRLRNELQDFHNFRTKATILLFPCSHRVQELLNFIDKKVQEILDSKSPDIRLKKIIECVEAIKNSRLVEYADKLWSIFLLKMYSFALFDNDLVEFQEIDIISDNVQYENSVRNSYRKIDESLQMHQHSNTQNMLMLYSVHRMSSRAFYNHDVIRQLYNALNSSKDLRERYLVTIKDNGRKKNRPSGGKTPSKCFAAMYNRDTKKKYAAISGVFDADKYIYPGVTTTKEKDKTLRRKQTHRDLVSLLKKILVNSYEVIDSDDDVTYYYKKNGKTKQVTAKRYISYPYPVDKRPGNRMFSCCERKLSTKLVPGCEHDFYVKYAPCIMCDRMISEETKNGAHFINVFYGGKIQDIRKNSIGMYDKSADDAN